MNGSSLFHGDNSPHRQLSRHAKNEGPDLFPGTFAEFAFFCGFAWNFLENLCVRPDTLPHVYRGQLCTIVSIIQICRRADLLFTGRDEALIW